MAVERGERVGSWKQSAVLVAVVGSSIGLSILVLGGVFSYPEAVARAGGCALAAAATAFLYGRHPCLVSSFAPSFLVFWTLFTVVWNRHLDMSAASKVVWLAAMVGASIVAFGIGRFLRIRTRPSASEPPTSGR